MRAHAWRCVRNVAIVGLSRRGIVKYEPVCSRVTLRNSFSPRSFCAKRSFMFSNAFASRIAQRLLFFAISRAYFCADGAVASCAANFLYSRYGAHRLCYVSYGRMNVVRNGRGILWHRRVSLSRNASNVRLFTRVREPTHDTSHASSIMKFY